MPRKRQSLMEVEAKEQRRRSLKAKRRLRGVMICPVCLMETVQLTFRGYRYKKIEGKVIKLRAGRMFCTNCYLRETMLLWHSEDLIDLYCFVYDREDSRIRVEKGLLWVLGEWP